MSSWRARFQVTLLIGMVLMPALPPPCQAVSRDGSRFGRVDLELVLAVDVSGSIASPELALQRNGYVQAFRSPELMRAVASGENGRIRVSYVEWGGPGTQTLAVSWTLIESPEDAEQFASRLAGLSLERPRGASPSTSISSLLLFSSGLFGRGGTVQAPRRVIDVSGNGPNNAGPPVLAARNEVVARGITINGLAIDLQSARLARANQLEVYFETCVIGGPGAFAVGIDDPSEVEQAILRKLLGEIIASAPALIRASAASGPLSMLDCLNPGQQPGR
jgi:hypothetical protein